jgi:hypothetical protein
MKKFIGYFIIGAASKVDAQNEKGMLLWSTHKPNAVVRFFNRVLLKIYWIDKERVLEEKGKRTHTSNSDIEFIRTSPSKYDRFQKPEKNFKTPPTKNRYKNEYRDNEKRFSSKRGFRPDQE